MMLYQGDTGLAAERYLIAVSERSVARVPIAHCDRFSSCAECVALRDPHCAWDLETKRCVLLNDLDGTYEQDISTGWAQGCVSTHSALQQLFFDAAPASSEHDRLQGIFKFEHLNEERQPH
ncbi:unnamed protein product [Gongylonema pulchrum]|uniref:PSI domain-containing protein n=1 Tax=Gongylonema pulchrum TaxID=637853 RepID=A0A183EUF4_9BILA|nr:unnamed protein product [Gongylonema pulchrum]